MRRSGRRALALAALAAGAGGVVLAVSSGLAAGGATSGVAAARATRLESVTRTVRLAGIGVQVTRKPSGGVCFRGGRAASCVASLGPAAIAYATARAGRRETLAGVAGPRVRAVIARLTRRGTTWARLRDGAFAALLPPGYRLRAIVKVLAGGRRVAFSAAS
jgi:hypothetical protein